MGYHNILQLAEIAGLRLFGRGEKRQLLCPFHNDRRPSAVVFAQSNRFYCSSCGQSLSAREFADRLGIVRGDAAPFTVVRPKPLKLPRFSATSAQDVWGGALARRRALHDDDRPVYEYLRTRGIEESLGSDLFGVLHEDLPLPPEVRHWPRRGFRLLVPLVDLTGTIVSLQARSIRTGSKVKVMTPRRARVAGTCFASLSGRRLLRDDAEGCRQAIIGEGLTDFLALARYSTVPILSVPGVTVASRIVSGWVVGLDVVLAFDDDPAGHRACYEVAKEVHRFGGRPIRARWPSGAKDACDALSTLGPTAFPEFLMRNLREIQK